MDRVLCKKAKNPVRIEDQRGRQQNARRVSEERFLYVKAHIASFPAEESHYSWQENLAARYLSGELTLAQMYRLYIDKCKEDGESPVKEHFYRNVFMTQFNLRFKKPRSDTCKTCEEMKMKISCATDDAEKESHKQKLELRHRKLRLLGKQWTKLRTGSYP